jgi:hypothetical protein
MDKKISQLTAATTPLSGTEQLPIVQGGVTVKATAQDVADLAPPPTEWLYVSSPVNKVFRLDGTENGKNKYTDPDDANSFIRWDGQWEYWPNENEYKYYTSADTTYPESGTWNDFDVIGGTASISITRYTGTLQEVLEEISKPKEWPKVYRALLTQSGTDAPVATVLENSLGGEVVWGYQEPGVYTATISGGFDSDKTFVLATGSNSYYGSGNINYIAAEIDTTVLYISAWSNTNPHNNFGAPCFIQILVYP